MNQEIVMPFDGSSPMIREQGKRSWETPRLDNLDVVDKTQAKPNVAYEYASFRLGS